MPKTHATPYISGFSLNLAKFIAKQITPNQRTNTLVKSFGMQNPQMAVQQTLYLGTRNIGTQTYVFGEKPTPPGASHKGLPMFSSVLPVDSPAVTSWLAAIDTVLDGALPEYRDESAESAASGPALYLRVNRVEAQMPWEKPEEQHIGVIISGYEDPEFTRQIEDVLIYVAFATDEFVQAFAQRNIPGTPGGELSQADLEQVRQAYNLYSLKDFLAQPGVLDGIGSLGAAFFTTLKSQVYNFSEIDVATIMANFQLPPGLAPEPEPVV